MPQVLHCQRLEIETFDPVVVRAKEIETISKQKVWSGPWNINQKCTWISDLDVAFPVWWEAQNRLSTGEVALERNGGESLRLTQALCCLGS